MPLCLLAGDSRRRNSWELAQSAESKPQRLTAKYWGPRVFRPARFPHTDAALICCICCWSCWAILFCSLSFCVSANFTTMGDEQPSMVCAWCIALIAVCAMALVVKVTNAQPRLSPSGPRNIRHSSICPNEENMTRMSFSVHFLEIIPINSFLSSTAKRVKHKRLEHYY